jgi:hypothetical protein
VFVKQSLGVMCIALACPFIGVPTLDAQVNPQARLQPRGLGVSPTFEGWYRNADGTYTLSFGFFNLNTEEILTIPVGENNSVSPGEVDQGQPTHFPPRRSYGVFTVRVPADFGGDDRVTWTLQAHGQRYAIPGGIIDSYETANLYAPAIDMYPPIVVMSEGGPETQGPAGQWIEKATRVGEPLELRVRAWDQLENPVTLRWYKYRGPGDVTFEEDAIRIQGASAEAVTTASFTEPGTYVLYARADHTRRSVSAAGLEQCCWTNGYVTVTVSN